MSEAGIQGVGPDAPTITTPEGGKHSHSPYAFHLVDAKALFSVAKVLSEGAEKYGEDNWRLIPVKDNLNHALQHIYAYLAGDTQDEHLAHAAFRTLFALAIELDPDGERKPNRRSLRDQSEVEADT